MGSKSVAELEAQRARLDARIKAAKAREGEAARKARNHAMIVMGGLLERAAGGDWTTVDMARMRAWLHAHSSEIASTVSVIEPTDEVSAGRRLRDWERAVREAAKAEGGE